MKLLVMLLLANAIFSSIDVLSTYVTALLLKVPVREINIFRLPILKFGREPAFTLGLIPIGSNVCFYEPLDRSDRFDREYLAYENIAIIYKLILNLSGFVFIFFLCSVFLSPTTAIGEIIQGFISFWRGVFDRTYGEQAIASTKQLIANNNLAVVLAFFNTKFIALNLMPIAPFRGFNLCLILLSAVFRQKISPNSFVFNTSLVIVMISVAKWFIYLIDSLYTWY